MDDYYNSPQPGNDNTVVETFKAPPPFKNASGTYDENSRSEGYYKGEENFYFNAFGDELKNLFSGARDKKAANASLTRSQAELNAAIAAKLQNPDVDAPASTGKIIGIIAASVIGLAGLAFVLKKFVFKN